MNHSKEAHHNFPALLLILKGLIPISFDLLEVESVDIIALVSDLLPQYDYTLTEGSQNKEILIGVRRGKFQQSIFTQKREFKLYNPYLRPGALMSVSFRGEFYSILYLHTDSGTEAPDFGNRNEMIEKIWSLKKALDKPSPEDTNAKFIAIGDLNTMGLQFPSRRKSDIRVSETDEIEALGAFAKKRGMTLLRKEFPHTFNNGSFISDLDHVLETENILFNELGLTQSQPFFVKVTGWQQLQGNARKKFIETISEHCSLYCQIR